jgi:hypothetical protein
MCIHVIDHVEEKEQELELRPMSYFASETDSFHLSQRNYEKLPPWFFNSDTMGSWNEQRKTFDFYVKIEVIGREGIYLSKKFYFILPQKEGDKPKFACKGIDKNSLTYEKLMTCLDNVVFDANEQTLQYKSGRYYVEIGKMSMKRRLIGTKVPDKEPQGSNIQSVYMARKIMPTFHLKRPRAVDNDTHYCLSQKPLLLRPHDDAHPVDIKNLEKGLVLDPFVYREHAQEINCEEELCVDLYHE